MKSYLTKQLKRRIRVRNDPRTDSSEARASSTCDERRRRYHCLLMRSVRPSSQKNRFTGRLVFAGANNLCGPMRLSPIARRHAFPGSKGSPERVGIFEAQQTSRFIQIQCRITEIVASHLMMGLVKNALEAGAGVLQWTLRNRELPECCW